MQRLETWRIREGWGALPLIVAQTFSLLYRRLPVGTALDARGTLQFDKRAARCSTGSLSILVPLPEP
jgi:hypothetical protein